METISKINFAAQCGISRAAVTQHAKRGVIAVTDSGDVITDHELTVRYLAERNARLNPLPKPKKKRKSRAKAPTPRPTAKQPALAAKTKPVKAAPAPAVKAKPPTPPNTPVVIKEQGRPLAELTAENFHNYSKQDLDKAKIYEQVLKTRQERLAKRGDLISRKLIEAIFARMYSVDVNELKAMEDRLTPAICGVFGVGDESPKSVKIRKMLNKEITQALRHIKRLMGDFLIDQKENAA